MVQGSCTELGAVISQCLQESIRPCVTEGIAVPPPSHLTLEREAQRKAATTLVAQTKHFHNHFPLRITVLYPKPKMEREDIVKSRLDKKSAAGNQGYPGKIQTLLGLVRETQLLGRPALLGDWADAKVPTLSQFPALEAARGVQWTWPLPKQTGELRRTPFVFFVFPFGISWTRA